MGEYNQLIKNMMQDCLVYDIETSSQYPDGRKISIRTDFDNYVKYAIVKWVGFYSYKYNKYMILNAIEQRSEIIRVFADHKVIIGVNNNAFDTPICINNELIKKFQHKDLDIQVILGNNKLKHHKNRAEYMGVNLKPVEVNGKKFGANSLMSLAKHFELPILKGDIEYDLFFQHSWDEQETKDIIKYLQADVEMTKLLFEKLTGFWEIFTDWLYQENVKDWNWVKCSIASLTYLAACKRLNVKPTYGKQGDKEEMGGRAVEPTQEETSNTHYIDEASKYPHIFAQFNLFNEIDVTGWTQEQIDEAIECGVLFHGNEMFKVKGYYSIKEQGILEKDVLHKLKTRIAAKKVLKKKNGKYVNIDENNYLKIEIPIELEAFIKDRQLSEYIINSVNGLQYAIKIFLNALYGAARSAIFEQIHTPNAGYDCCWIGQQMHEYVHKFFEKKGYKIVGGFTDSWFIEAKEGDTKEHIIALCNEVMTEMKKYMPFPANTHIIDYETFMDYLLYNLDEKRNEYKRNNYCYISGDYVKIVGFPIKKNNASKLGLIIFNKYLKPEGIKKKRLKFTREYIQELIEKELKKDISVAAVEIKCKPSESYKALNQIQAQVSRAYFDGLDGRIDLIKNFNTGKVGKTNKYCTVEEAKAAGLNINHLDLSKIWNELNPFIERPKEIDLFEFDDGEEEDDYLFTPNIEKESASTEVKEWF